MCRWDNSSHVTALFKESSSLYFYVILFLLRDAPRHHKRGVSQPRAHRAAVISPPTPLPHTSLVFPLFPRTSLVGLGVLLVP